MKTVVPKITPNSSLHDLTLFLFYSFQEPELKMVRDILTSREDVFKEEIQRYKQILEELEHSRVVYEEKMKEKCHVLEKEGEFKRRILEEEVESLREKCEYFRQSRVELKEKMEEKCGVLEKEVEGLREKCEELKRESGFASLMKKKLEKGRVEFEEKMKEKSDALEKEGQLKRRILEEEVESLREKCEELKKGSDLLENMLSLQKRELDYERRMQQEMLENQNDVLQKGFKEELEKMRECHTKELKRNHDIMKKKLSLCVFEKMQMEKELEKSLMQNEEARKEFEGKLEKEREVYEEELKREIDFGALTKMEVENLMQSRVDFEKRMKKKCYVLAKKEKLKRKVLEEKVESWKEKCEELERNHGMMKKKLSLGVSEKLQLEKELKKSLMQNEEARKELEGEPEKARKIYEEELKRERDLRENNLALAELEKMDLEEELKKSRKDFEERIQVLEVKNLELNKKGERHIESLWKINSLAELIKGASVSAISGNVSAHELLTDAGEKEKSGCLFLENELEDRGYNENNSRLNCKRRRSINESEDDGSGLSSVYSRVESHVIPSQNKEVAGCQTGKEITWRQSADMLSALRNDPELCMASVSALYRRHISAGNPSNKGVLSGIDIVRATAVAKYLVNNDPANKLSRSMLEVQQDCPFVLQTCWKLANQYKEHIFEIYQKGLDPLFCPKS